MNEKLKSKLNRLAPEINLASWTLSYVFKKSKFNFSKKDLYTNIDELANLKEKYEKENCDLSDKIGDQNRILDGKDSKIIALSRSLGESQNKLVKYQIEVDAVSWGFEKAGGDRGFLGSVKDKEVRLTWVEENSRLKETIKGYFKESAKLNNRVCDLELSLSISESKLQILQDEHRRLGEYSVGVNNKLAILENVDIARLKSEISTSNRERDYYKSSSETVDA